MLVNSIPGQGTSFTVILPLANQPDVKESQKRVPIERHKLNFLVIDDEINILKMMEMFFEDTEIDLATALTAEAGLQAIHRARHVIYRYSATCQSTGCARKPKTAAARAPQIKFSRN